MQPGQGHDVRTHGSYMGFPGFVFMMVPGEVDSGMHVPVSCESSLALKPSVCVALS